MDQCNLAGLMSPTFTTQMRRASWSVASFTCSYVSLKLGGVELREIARVTNIVGVVVHTTTTTTNGSLLLVPNKQTSGVLLVVLSLQQSDQVRHFHGCLEIVLELLAQASHLRYLQCIAVDLVEDLCSSFDNPFKDADNAAAGKSCLSSRSKEELRR